MEDFTVRFLGTQVQMLKRYLEREEKIVDDVEHLPSQWTDDEAYAFMNGSAIRDDPPRGWGKSRIAQYGRGEARGRDIVAGNAMQYVEMIERILAEPDEWTEAKIHERWGKWMKPKAEETTQS